MTSDVMSNAFDALAAQIAVLDEHGVIVRVNAAWQRFGADVEAPTSEGHVGWSYLDVCRKAAAAGDASAADVQRGLAGVLERTLAKYVTHYRCPTPARELWLRMTVTPLEGGGAVVVHDDVTRLVSAERQQALLTEELSHRVKNTLAIVQAIASQTARGATDTPSFRTAFLGRIIALGRVHDLLTRSDWSGAGLAEVVAATLAPFRQTNDEVISIGGPPAEIDARTAVTLTLALHELATNALKYGALKVPDGRVDVSWTAADDPSHVRLHWMERGGPPVTPPAHEGFGTRLLRSMGRDATVTAAFPPEGVRCLLDVRTADRRNPTA